jgi:hypothetical protein
VFEDWQLWRVEVSWVAEKEVPVTQLRQKMLEELQGRKITALALGLVQDLVVRSDSRSFGVAGSSSRCAVASIVW